MSHSHPFNALILKTYDVGEADRYCVLFTKELGRVSARASGVRRTKSRMGGSLLPFQQATIQLKESSAGYIIAGVQAKESLRQFENLSSFAQAQQGIELLLALTDTEDPLPEIFDATVSFLQICGRSHPHAVLGYTLHLLHFLGFLPEGEEMEQFADLSQDEQAFLDQSLQGKFDARLSAHSAERLNAVCVSLLRDQLTVPLKAGAIVGRM